MDSIGGRVLERMRLICPGIRQQELADDVGMTPDAFSRALNGKRQFASIELARLADRLDTDLHWLVTGVPDPSRLRVAARHDFDHETGRRDVPGRGGDERTLLDIGIAYRQAFPEPRQRPGLPKDADAVRAVLGDDFVRPMADRLEDRLGVGVVRVAELSTAYSFTLGGRDVIALPATGNWFRENWSMGHELGHLVLGHHDEGLEQDTSEQHEAAANAFAADLLLPKDIAGAVDWAQVNDTELAWLAWSWGVSVDALARRLQHVMGFVPERLRAWDGQPTQRLLRRHLDIPGEGDEITTRMDAAAQRRFPVSVQEAHLDRVANGEVGPATLAWMLGIDESALEIDAPEPSEVTVSELTKSLGL